MAPPPSTPGARYLRPPLPPTEEHSAFEDNVFSPANEKTAGAVKRTYSERRDSSTSDTSEFLMPTGKKPREGDRDQVTTTHNVLKDIGSSACVEHEPSQPADHALRSHNHISANPSGSLYGRSGTRENMHTTIQDHRTPTRTNQHDYSTCSTPQTAETRRRLKYDADSELKLTRQKALDDISNSNVVTPRLSRGAPSRAQKLNISAGQTPKSQTHYNQPEFWKHMEQKLLMEWANFNLRPAAVGLGGSMCPMKHANEHLKAIRKICFEEGFDHMNSKIQKKISSGILYFEPNMKVRDNRNMRKELVDLFLENVNPVWLLPCTAAIFDTSHVCAILQQANEPTRDSCSSAPQTTEQSSRALTIEGLRELLDDALFGDHHASEFRSNATNRKSSISHADITGHNGMVLHGLLMLLYLLDVAKQRGAAVIAYDPPLFIPDSNFKAMEDMLKWLGNNPLKKHGDLKKQLGYLGYKLYHVAPLFDCEESILFRAFPEDLTSCLRLAKLVHIMTGDQAVLESIPNVRSTDKDELVAQGIAKSIFKTSMDAAVRYVGSMPDHGLNLAFVAAMGHEVTSGNEYVCQELLTELCRSWVAKKIIPHTNDLIAARKGLEQILDKAHKEQSEKTLRRRADAPLAPSELWVPREAAIGIADYALLEWVAMCGLAYGQKIVDWVESLRDHATFCYIIDLYCEGDDSIISLDGVKTVTPAETRESKDAEMEAKQANFNAATFRAAATKLGGIPVFDLPGRMFIGEMTDLSRRKFITHYMYVTAAYLFRRLAEESASTFELDSAGSAPTPRDQISASAQSPVSYQGPAISQNLRPSPRQGQEDTADEQEEYVQKLMSEAEAAKDENRSPEVCAPHEHENFASLDATPKLDESQPSGSPIPPQFTLTGAPEDEQQDETRKLVARVKDAVKAHKLFKLAQELDRAFDEARLVVQRAARRHAAARHLRTQRGLRQREASELRRQEHLKNTHVQGYLESAQGTNLHVGSCPDHGCIVEKGIRIEECGAAMVLQCAYRRWKGGQLLQVCQKPKAAINDPEVTSSTKNDDPETGPYIAPPELKYVRKDATNGPPESPAKTQPASFAPEVSRNASSPGSNGGVPVDGLQTPGRRVPSQMPNEEFQVTVPNPADVPKTSAASVTTPSASNHEPSAQERILGTSIRPDTEEGTATPSIPSTGNGSALRQPDGSERAGVSASLAPYYGDGNSSDQPTGPRRDRIPSGRNSEAHQEEHASHETQLVAPAEPQSSPQGSPRTKLMRSATKGFSAMGKGFVEGITSLASALGPKPPVVQVSFPIPPIDANKAQEASQHATMARELNALRDSMSRLERRSLATPDLSSPQEPEGSRDSHADAALRRRDIEERAVQQSHDIAEIEDGRARALEQRDIEEIANLDQKLNDEYVASKRPDSRRNSRPSPSAQGTPASLSRGNISFRSPVSPSTDDENWERGSQPTGQEDSHGELSNNLSNDPPGDVLPVVSKSNFNGSSSSARKTASPGSSRRRKDSSISSRTPDPKEFGENSGAAARNSEAAERPRIPEEAHPNGSLSGRDKGKPTARGSHGGARQSFSNSKEQLDQGGFAKGDRSSPFVRSTYEANKPADGVSTANAAVRDRHESAPLASKTDTSPRSRGGKSAEGTSDPSSLRLQSGRLPAGNPDVQRNNSSRAVENALSDGPADDSGSDSGSFHDALEHSPTPAEERGSANGGINATNGAVMGACGHAITDDMTGTCPAGTESAKHVRSGVQSSGVESNDLSNQVKDHVPSQERSAHTSGSGKGTWSPSARPTPDPSMLSSAFSTLGLIHTQDAQVQHAEPVGQNSISTSSTAAEQSSFCTPAHESGASGSAGLARSRTVHIPESNGRGFGKFSADECENLDTETQSTAERAKAKLPTSKENKNPSGGDPMSRNGHSDRAFSGGEGSQEGTDPDMRFAEGRAPTSQSEEASRRTEPSSTQTQQSKIFEAPTADHSLYEKNQGLVFTDNTGSSENRFEHRGLGADRGVGMSELGKPDAFSASKDTASGRKQGRGSEHDPADMMNLSSSVPDSLTRTTNVPTNQAPSFKTPRSEPRHCPRPLGLKARAAPIGNPTAPRRSAPGTLSSQLSDRSSATAPRFAGGALRVAPLLDRISSGADQEEGCFSRIWEDKERVPQASTTNLNPSGFTLAPEPGNSLSSESCAGTQVQQRKTPPKQSLGSRTQVSDVKSRQSVSSEENERELGPVDQGSAQSTTRPFGSRSGAGLPEKDQACDDAEVLCTSDAAPGGRGISDGQGCKASRNRAETDPFVRQVAPSSVRKPISGSPGSKGRRVRVSSPPANTMNETRMSLSEHRRKMNERRVPDAVSSSLPASGTTNSPDSISAMASGETPSRPKREDDSRWPVPGTEKTARSTAESTSGIAKPPQTQNAMKPDTQENLAMPSGNDQARPSLRSEQASGILETSLDEASIHPTQNVDPAPTVRANRPQKRVPIGRCLRSNEAQEVGLPRGASDSVIAIHVAFHTLRASAGKPEESQALISSAKFLRSRSNSPEGQVVMAEIPDVFDVLLTCLQLHRHQPEVCRPVLRCLYTLASQKSVRDEYSSHASLASRLVTVHHVLRKKAENLRALTQSQSNSNSSPAPSQRLGRASKGRDDVWPDSGFLEDFDTLLRIIDAPCE